MNCFHCDVCGKATFINPPARPVFEDKKVGEKVIKAPKMQTLRSINFSTGEMVDQAVPVMEDLKPRAHLIKLNAGQQSIMRDFCEECLDKHVMPEVRALWDKLEKIKGIP